MIMGYNTQESKSIKSNPIKLLPMQISSERPITCSSGDRYKHLKLFVCSPNLYDGCTFTLDYNIPDDRWDYRNGNYFDFKMLGGEKCNKLLCQNDPKGPDGKNNICSFRYSPELGTELYVYSNCGLTSAVTATANIRIDCINKIPANYTSYTAGCPVNTLGTKQSIHLDTIDTVPTSKETDDANLYSFTACGDPTKKIKLNFAITGVTKESAFQTYVCDVPDCYTENSKPGWFDDSGTSFNIIEIDNLGNMQLWFIIYGRGLYKKYNNYTLGIDVSSHT